MADHDITVKIGAEVVGVDDMEGETFTLRRGVVKQITALVTNEIRERNIDVDDDAAIEILALEAPNLAHAIVQDGGDA